LVTLNASVLSVKDAIDTFKTAQENLDVVRNAYLSNLGSGISAAINTGNLKLAIESLETSFKTIDTTPDGMLTGAELTAALGSTATSAQIELLFDAIDINKNGVVTAFELSVANIAESLKTVTVAGVTNGATTNYTLDAVATEILKLMQAGKSASEVAAIAQDTYGISSPSLGAAAQTIADTQTIIAGASNPADAAVITSNAASVQQVATYASMTQAQRDLAIKDTVIWFNGQLGQDWNSYPLWNSIYTSAKANGYTSADVIHAMTAYGYPGWTTEGLRTWFAAMQPYGAQMFDKGTNYLPSDMIAQVHEGERIIPAADNRELMARLQSPQENSAALVAEIRALRQTNDRLERRLEAIERNTHASAVSNANTADSTRTMTRDGVQVWTDPAEPLKTEAA